jgi:hypothetical protein
MAAVVIPHFERELIAALGARRRVAEERPASQLSFTSLVCANFESCGG